MATNKEILDKYKDYEPEVVEYDEETDGSLEHLVRDKHLEKKEELKKIFEKRMKKVSTGTHSRS